MLQLVEIINYQYKEVFVKLSYIVHFPSPLCNTYEMHCKALVDSIRAKGYDNVLGIMKVFFAEDVNPGASKMNDLSGGKSSQVTVRSGLLMLYLDRHHCPSYIRMFKKDWNRSHFGSPFRENHVMHCS